MMSICESKLSEFSALGTLAAVSQIAEKPDNFKVRRDASFALLLGRAADVLAVLEATPQELVNTSQGVAKLGLRRPSLLNSAVYVQSTRSAHFSAPQLATMAWSFALLVVPHET